MKVACFHCWHSDPDTSGKSRWYCCRDGCDATCRQNYLDVRKCKHCNLRMLVDLWGFCGICGEFVMSWIFERTLADSLKPDQAAVVEEYLSVRKLPNIKEIREQIGLSLAAGRQQSAHGHMRHGHGGRSSSKIMNRSGSWDRGRRNSPSARKQGESYFRRVSFRDDDLHMPTEEFWALFDRVKTGTVDVKSVELLAKSATVEQLAAVEMGQYG